MKNDNLLKNTVLLVTGTIINKGILFIAIPLFSRWLSTEEYGLFDVYTARVSLIIPVVTISIGDAVFRFAIDKESINKKAEFITNGLIIEICSLFLFAIAIIVFLHSWELAFPFLCYAISEGISIFLLGFLRSLRKLDIYSFSSIFSTCFTFLFVYVFVKKLRLGLKGMLYGYAIGTMANNIVIMYVTKFCRYILFNKRKFKIMQSMIKYSFAFVLSNISWWIVNVSDRQIINIFLGASYNGIYAASTKLPNLITTLTSMFNISWQQTAVDSVKEKQNSISLNILYNKLCKLFLTSASCGIATNYFVFRFFFDYRYYDGQLYMPILIISSMFHGMIFFFTGLNISKKRPEKNGICVLIGAIINFLLNILFIKRFGLYSVAISTLVSNYIIFKLAQLTVEDVFIIKYEKLSILCFFELFMVFILDKIIISPLIQLLILIFTIFV